MKTRITYILSVVLMVMATATYAANSGVSNIITGDPGNSAAARDVLGPGSGDANCVGDQMSQIAKNNKGASSSVKSGGPGSVTQRISLLVTIGSLVGLVGLDCSDFVFP